MLWCWSEIRGSPSNNTVVRLEKRKKGTEEVRRGGERDGHVCCPMGFYLQLCSADLASGVDVDAQWTGLACQVGIVSDSRVKSKEQHRNNSYVNSTAMTSTFKRLLFF